jgi:hypothetical protein
MTVGLAIHKNYFGGANMKKFIIFLFVLLTAGTSVFTQEAQAAPRNPLDGWSFNGFMYSTMGYDIDQQTWGGTDVMIDGASMSFLYYTRMGVDYDRDNYGFALSVMAISGYDTSDSMRSPLPSVYQAYGWMNFFEKKMEVKMGWVRDSTYNSGGRISTDGGEGAGALIKFNPFTGLSIGGGVYAPRLPTLTEVTRDPTISKNGTGPVEQARVTWGVTYELSKVFKITNAGSWRDNTFPTITSGLHLLAVPNLTAIVEVFANNILYKQPEAGYPLIAFDQTLSYRVGRQLQFGINAYQFLNNTNMLVSKGGGGNVFGSIAYDRVDNVGGMDLHSENYYDVGFSVDPWVSYQIGMFVPRLNMSFEGYGNQAKTTMVATGMVMNDRETERFLISLKPQLSIRLGMASLDLSYALQMITDTVNDEKADMVYDNKLTVMFALVF